MEVPTITETEPAPPPAAFDDARMMAPDEPDAVVPVSRVIEPVAPP